MDFNDSEKGKLEVSMAKYLEKTFNGFPEKIGRQCVMPVANCLFHIRYPEETKQMGKYLPEEKVQHFHHAIALLVSPYRI